jgi:hypothetical protein
MTPHRFHPLLPIFLLIGALAAVAVLFFRHQAETRNGRVELTVDHAQVASLAAAAGVSVDAALGQLKSGGVTSIALTEESVADLIAAGAAHVYQERVSGWPTTVVRFADRASMDRVATHLTHRVRFPARDAHPTARVMLSAPRAPARVYPVSWDTLRGLDIGLSPVERAQVGGAGLGIVGRMSNFSAARPESIRWVLHELKRSGARVIVFTGDEVLGHRSRVKETAASLDAEGLLYGSVEMGKQRGDEDLSRALDSRIVRVHAVQAAEMARLTPPLAIERYVRAVRERNIRVAYLRLFTAVADDPLAQNREFVRGVAEELREHGYSPGAAVPFEPVLTDLGPLGRLLPPLVALLVAGGGLMLLGTVAPFPPGRQLLPALLLGALAVGLAQASPGPGRKLLALAGAVLFPTLAFTLWPLSARGREGEVAQDHRSSGVPPPRPLAPGSGPRGGRTHSASLLVLSRFAAISLVSLLGGLAVGGLLSDRPALVKVSEFSGIKAAQALPLLMLTAVLVGDLWAPAGTWEAHRRAVAARVTRALGEPLKLWHTLAALAALVIVVLMLLRTGNDPGVGVSPLELRFRSLLDQFLVRPRTKEFLLGHPALVVALFLWITGRGRSLVAPMLLIATIGQAGMVNSFCHLHTPIALTLARTGNGLWLGALIGLAICLVVSRVEKKRQSAQRHEADTKSTKADLIVSRIVLFVSFVPALCLCGELFG